MAVQIKNTSFFYTCKENYFLGILPADPQSKSTEGYKTLVKIAKIYFSADLYEPITQYLTEGRYFIKLWSAYLTLEYGKASDDLKQACIKTIENTVRQFSAELPAGLIGFFEQYLRQKSRSSGYLS